MMTQEKEFPITVKNNYGKSYVKIDNVQNNYHIAVTYLELNNSNHDIGIEDFKRHMMKKYNTIITEVIRITPISKSEYDNIRETPIHN